MAYPACDVCGFSDKENGVASSPLAPISFCYCAPCLFSYAEPLWMWHATIDCVGGVEHLRKDLKAIACAWYEGEYIYWDKILELYVPDLDSDGEPLDEEDDVQGTL